MRLTGIEKPSLKTAHFELPPGAKMTDMGALSSGGAAKDQSSGDSNFIKDLGAGAGDAAKDEVKQNTLDEVKKGVGGMFKKLFK